MAGPSASSSNFELLMSKYEISTESALKVPFDFGWMTRDVRVSNSLANCSKYLEVSNPLTVRRDLMERALTSLGSHAMCTGNTSLILFAWKLTCRSNQQRSNWRNKDKPNTNEWNPKNTKI